MSKYGPSGLVRPELRGTLCPEHDPCKISVGPVLSRTAARAKTQADTEVAQMLIETFQPRMDVYAERFDAQADVDRYNAWLADQAFKAPTAALGCWKPAGKKGSRKPVTKEAMAVHVAGVKTLGFYPMRPDGTTNFLGVDFDNHRGDKTTAADPRADYDATVLVLDRRGVPYLGWHSRGGRGYWVVLLLPAGTRARAARAVMHGILREAGVKPIDQGGTFDALFPKQDQPNPAKVDNPIGSPGNLYCLPLSRRWAANDPPGGVFVGVDLKDWNAQVAHLRSAQRITPEKWDDLVAAYPPAETTKTKARTKHHTARWTSGNDAAGESTTRKASVWEIALRKAGRLGMALEDGKYAVLCIQDNQHSTPDGSAEHARGSCVLHPPCDERNLGYPKCSHAHCSTLTLDDWIEGVGQDTWDDARLESRRMKRAGSYLEHDGGISTWMQDEDGEIVPDPEGELANFTARIMADFIEFDGEKETRSYEIEACVQGVTRTLRVPASEFGSMGWVATQLGGAAIIAPGYASRDQVRSAVQRLSIPIAERKTYTFTGWHEIDGRFVYLHAGGAIGTEGDVPGVDVQLDGRAKLFKLPTPPTGEELIRCERASLDLLSLGPADVWVLVMGLVYRAPIDTTSVTMYLSGEQTFGKTLIVSLAQSHYGAGFSETCLPATWKNSTAAALNQIRSMIGHAVFVVDDYLETGNDGEDKELRAKVERVVRNQHSGVGALRLARETRRTEDERPSRSALLSAGEQLPRGHSLRSRMLVSHLSQRVSVDLGLRREMARQGVYASAMAGFIQWLSTRFAEIRSKKDAEISRIAAQISSDLSDMRTAMLLADLAFGIKTRLQYAQDIGAITNEEAVSIQERACATMKQVARLQAESQKSQDPVSRFFDLVGQSIASGEWHLTSTEGMAPENPAALGWACQRMDEWRPHGASLGVIDGDLVWLHRDAVIAAVKGLAQRTGDPWSLSTEELVRRLYEKNLLAKHSMNTKRQTYYAQRRIGGRDTSKLICLRAVDIGLDQSRSTDDEEVHPAPPLRLVPTLPPCEKGHVPPRPECGACGQFFNEDGSLRTS